MSDPFDLSLKIAGPAGFGIKVAGSVFSKSAMRQGLKVIDYSEYPSLIRGGHNVFFVRASSTDMFSHRNDIDILVALDKASVDIHARELSDNGLIIYDPDEFVIESDIDADRLCGIPLSGIIKEANGKPIMKNTAAMGALMATAGLEMEPFLNVIVDSFKGKSPEVIKANRDIAIKGYEYARDNCYCLNKNKLTDKFKPQILIEGNEAIALGAIQSGCRFYAAYPMTPASSILHFMAEHDEEFGIVVKHAEDEIAVMNMAIGAAYAGARAMVGTSGGGFSLMVEALGLAGISETPVVVIEVARPGPATGLPTWQEQGDILFLQSAAQGEFPRVILTPGDVEECFYFAHQAFNIADIIQTPVLVLSDQYLSESHETCAPFELGGLKIDRGKILSNSEAQLEEDYLRYRDSDDGVSYRALPGQPNCRFIANSYEHDEYGYADETSKNRIMMNEKRFRKLDGVEALLPPPKKFGAMMPKIGIIGCGSTKRPILQAMNDLDMDDALGYLHLTHLAPFPVKAARDFIDVCEVCVVIDNNFTGQLGQLLKMNGLDAGPRALHRYDGRPFNAVEIMDMIKEVSLDVVYD